MQSTIGGKIITLQSSLPNLSEGSLKSREDPKLLGTSNVCAYKTFVLFIIFSLYFFINK